MLLEGALRWEDAADGAKQRSNAAAAAAAAAAAVKASEGTAGESKPEEAAAAAAGGLGEVNLLVDSADCVVKPLKSRALTACIDLPGYLEGSVTRSSLFAVQVGGRV